MEMLATNFIQQLQSHFLTEELANQVVKNMVFIARISKLIPDSKKKQHVDEDDEDESDNEDNEQEDEKKKKKRMTFPWLVRKLVREANHEAVSNTKITMKVNIELT